MSEYMRVKNPRKAVVFLFFIILFLTGLKIFKDYGVHWDEHYNQDFGGCWTDYARKALSGGPISAVKVPDFTDHNLTHGPAFEILLVVVKKIFNLHDPRDIIFMRHLATFFIFFMGSWFFYLLCKIHFKSWKTALSGSLFLILSPRLFADAFYNTVDIPFLSFYILGAYTLIRLLDKKSLNRVFFHAFTCALLIGIRPIGITLAFYTFVFLSADILRIQTRKTRAGSGGTFLVYILSLFTFVIIFWPALWSHPVLNLITAARQMKDYAWPFTCLYLGKFIIARNLPWHYSSVWLLISTPLFYSFLFFIGCLASAASFFKNEFIPDFNPRNTVLFAVMFFLPLTTGRGHLYDGWRHLYFVYPAFLAFALTGLIAVVNFLKIKFRGHYKIILPLTGFITIVSLSGTAWFMIRYHPYQNVYFNALAGRDMKEIKERFELDYWGLSYRKALEYILQNDKDAAIKVFAANMPGEISADILAPADRKRLLIVKSPGKAKYFLSNYRWHPQEYPYGQEFFSIKIRDAKIMVVYKLK